MTFIFLDKDELVTLIVHSPLAHIGLQFILYDLSVCHDKRDVLRVGEAGNVFKRVAIGDSNVSDPALF